MLTFECFSCRMAKKSKFSYKNPLEYNFIRGLSCSLPENGNLNGILSPLIIIVSTLKG